MLESNREVQRSEYADLVTARTERLQAKADLLHKLMELEMSHVKVKGVLGILVAECGSSAWRTTRRVRDGRGGGLVVQRSRETRTT